MIYTLTPSEAAKLGSVVVHAGALVMHEPGSASYNKSFAALEGLVQDAEVRGFLEECEPVLLPELEDDPAGASD